MSDGTYGAPRIRAELAEVDGLHVGIKRIARLMRNAGIALQRLSSPPTRTGSTDKQQ